MSLTAFAIKDSRGGIRLDTLYGTPRGAKVNYIHVHAGVPIYSSHTDEDIERFWKYAAANYGAELVEVDIIEKNKS